LGRSVEHVHTYCSMKKLEKMSEEDVEFFGIGAMDNF
jgi:hypothetical protein